MFMDHAHEFTEAGWRRSQDVIGKDPDGDVEIIWEKRHGSGIANDRFRRVHEQAGLWYQGDWKSIRHQTPRTSYRGPDSRHGYSRSGTNGHTGALKEGYRWTDDGTRLMRSVIQAPTMWRRGAIHPTEKSPEILTPLIEYSTAPGDLILDPFAGSASTLATARSLARRAVGIEYHEPYIEKAAKRLSHGVQYALDTGGAA
jgi:site-specific DNA-methyltransferase (adenine-specific)